jgi:hypothetical protein
MPPPTTPGTGFGDATTQVVVLAFDLVGQQLANLPSLLEKSLLDSKVQDAISSTLGSFMLQRMVSGAGTTNMNPKDAKDLINALQAAGESKVHDALTQQITKTPEYLELQQAIQHFENAAKFSPMGVWIDRNQGIVIVVGIALVVGGAAALYATKTGGTAINLGIDQVKGKPLQIFKVGRLTVQGQLLSFQPDKRTLGAGLIATAKWQKLDVSIKFGVIAAGSQVREIDGAVILKSQDVNVSVTGTATPVQKTFNLGLSLSFDTGPLAPLKVGVGAIVTNDKLTGGSLNASLKTPAGEFGLKGQADTKGKPEYKGLATWTVHF